jgi:hypothetical protein
MKRILRIALSVATLVLIAGVAVYIVLGIGRMRLEGEQSASAEYTILRNAVSMISGEQDLGDQFVRDRLKSLYQASSHLLAMQILDKNGLVLWKMPDESAYFSAPSSGTGSVFNAPAISTVIYMTPLADGMKLMALYSIFSRKDFSSLIRLPLIGLALWLVLLVIMQFALREKGSERASSASVSLEGTTEAGSSEESSSEESSSEEGSSEEGASEVLDEEAPLQGAQEEESVLPEEQAPPIAEPQFDQTEPTSKPALEPAPESTVEPAPEPVQEALEEEIQQAPPPQMHQEPEPVWEEDIRPAAAEAPPQAEEAEIGQAEFIEPPAAEELQQPDTFPPSLMSQPLERMLESELQSKHSTELSLMLIECALSGREDPSAAALGVTIKEYVTAESLVFEIARGCYAVVLPGVDAGSCLKLAVDLDDMLTATASLYKDITGEPPFYFGISAVYGRTLTASRLYREAYAALEKARESSSRILAFKPAAS